MIILCILYVDALSQEQQVWFDFQVDYPFRNQYLFEVTTSYQTNVLGASKWTALSFDPSVEAYFFTRLDLFFALPFAYTTQVEDYNTFETTASLGARFHITQNKRIDTRIVFRVEQRFMHNEESDWEKSNRLRLKGEATIAINRPNLFTDKLWYGILDYEEFFVTDQQLDERYAYRRRGRFGVGYRLSYKHRFELIYTLQSSRDQIAEDFASTDNVLQLRYKMFLNPSKPVAPAINQDN